MPNLISSLELKCEYEFTRALERQHAVGARLEKPILCSLFESRSPVDVTPEDFDELRWGQFGLTPEDANRMCGIAETRAAPFHQQLCAYAGWLMTNTRCLDEIKHLKQRELGLFSTDLNEEDAKECHVAFEAFLDKWQLGRLATWDLPPRNHIWRTLARQRTSKLGQHVYESLTRFLQSAR